MLSVTDLSTYEYCPRQLYIKKVLKIIPPPNKAMVLGTVRHETFESMSKSEEKLIPILTSSNYSEILGIFKKNSSQVLQNAIIKNKTKLTQFNQDLSETFRIAWNSVLLETKDRAYSVHQFMEKSGLKGQELWENLTPKVEVEKWIESKELQIRGIIDKLEIYPEKVIPVELKTGKIPHTGVWPGHQLQIGAYVMLLKDQGHEVDSGFVKYLDHDEIRTVPFNPFVEKKVLEVRDSIVDLLESQEIPPKKEHKCNVCNEDEECFKDSYLKEKMKELKN